MMMYYVCNFTVCLWNTPDSFAATNPFAAFSDPSILFWRIEFNSKILTAGVLSTSNQLIASASYNETAITHSGQTQRSWNSRSQPIFWKNRLPQQKHYLQIFFFSSQLFWIEALPTNPAARGGSIGPGAPEVQDDFLPEVTHHLWPRFVWLVPKKKHRPCACETGQECFGDEIRPYPANVGKNFHKPWNKNHEIRINPYSTTRNDSMDRNRGLVPWPQFGSTPDGSFLQWFFSAPNSALDSDENSQEIGWFVG